MFLCEKCIPKNAKWLFMTLLSYGKCENCGKVESCVDYHGNSKINNEDEENSPGGSDD